jgi:predicted RNA-binding Zn ribbon-like protein
MSEVSFDMDAGDVSLDFANTMNWHASVHPEENLHNYEDLVAWGKAAGLISEEENEHTCSLADERPVEAEKAYREALRLREAIYRVFSNRYAGSPIPEEDLKLLNQMVSQAMTHRQVVSRAGEFRWEWDSECDEPDMILWKVAMSAADLLTSDEVTRVRECEDDRGCGYLFIDMSKNHSRRWCSMDSCGNRAKALRHYSRSKAEPISLG